MRSLNYLGRLQSELVLAFLPVSSALLFFGYVKGPFLIPQARWVGVALRT